MRFTGMKTQMIRVDGRSGKIANKTYQLIEKDIRHATKSRRGLKSVLFKTKEEYYVNLTKDVFLTEYECDTLSQRSQICMHRSKIYY